MASNTVDSSSSIPDREFIVQLEQAVKNLLWISEAEYPFQVVYWHDASSFSEDNLLQQSNYSLETKIAIQEFQAFFWSATKQETWHNEAEQAEAKRYQALVELMAANLKDIRVYLLGEIEIDAYILGETEHNASAGLATKIVST